MANESGPEHSGERGDQSDTCLSDAPEISTTAHGERALVLIHEAACDTVGELVQHNYPDAINSLKKFGLHDPEDTAKFDNPIPDLQTILRVIKSQITPEQITAIDDMREPILQLIPVTSGSRYIHSFNTTLPQSHPSYLSTKVKNAIERTGNRGDRIIGWKAAITEGADYAPKLPGENLNLPLKARLQWFKEHYFDKGVSCVGFHRYLLLQMLKLSKNQPEVADKFSTSDKNSSWTIISPQDDSDDHILGGYWGCDDQPPRFDFEEFNINTPFPNGHFRTSVLFDISSSSPESLCRESNPPDTDHPFERLGLDEPTHPRFVRSLYHLRDMPLAHHPDQ